MNRLFALALVISLGSTSVAFAGEPLSASASRLARESTASQSLSQSKPDPVATAGFVSFAIAARVGVAPARNAAILAQQSGTVSSSGMSKRTKMTIYLAAAAAFAGTAYGIDHRVKDVTPSSLGTRQD